MANEEMKLKNKEMCLHACNIQAWMSSIHAAVYGLRSQTIVLANSPVFKGDLGRLRGLLVKCVQQDVK